MNMAPPTSTCQMICFSFHCFQNILNKTGITCSKNYLEFENLVYAVLLSWYCSLRGLP